MFAIIWFRNTEAVGGKDQFLPEKYVIKQNNHHFGLNSFLLMWSMALNPYQILFPHWKSKTHLLTFILILLISIVVVHFSMYTWC